MMPFDDTMRQYLTAIRARTRTTEINGNSTHRSVLSYVELRRALGLLGLTLPIVLIPIGFLMGIGVQSNFSSYYHTRMRDVFVGYMCAMGIFFYCYRGHSRWEEWTSRTASASSLGVALFPLDSPDELLRQSTVYGWIHLVAGAGFFLTAAIFSLFHFPKTEREVDIGPWFLEPASIYRICGLTILACCFLMGLQVLFLPTEWNAFLNRGRFILWMEWVATWAFAAAWLTKSHTLLVEIALDLARITWEKTMDDGPRPD